MASNNPNQHHYWNQQHRYTAGTNGNSYAAPSYPYGNQNPPQSMYSHPFVAPQVTSQYFPPPYQYANGVYSQQTSMQYVPPPPPPPPPQAPAQYLNGNLQSKTPGDDLNTNHQYHCDACSISFPTLSALNSHSASHIQCTKCEFVGSKKVVSAHFKSTHGQWSGRGLKTVTIQVPGSKYSQKFKICVGNHPDDIQEWIAERKKKFPTKANIALKEERKRKRTIDDHLTTTPSNDTKTSSFKESMNDLKKETKNTQHGSTTLSTLMAGYDSSSDEENNITSPIQPIAETTAILNDSAVGLGVTNTHKTKQCRFFLRNGTCKNGDNCTYIHDISKHKEYKANSLIRKQTQSERDKARNALKKEMDILTTGRSQSGKKSEASLLRKLLNNDIRRERTLCLQLLRYIADCNYLQGKREGKDSIINSST